MDEKQLKGQLSELSAAIDQLQGVDTEKDKLSVLIDDINRQLDQPLLTEGDPDTLAEQVDSLISSFESEHPAVAGILNNIMTTLSSMGI